MIGGLTRRSAHQFDGEIAAVRIASGMLADEAVLGDSTRWPTAGAVAWRARLPATENYEWTGSATTAESADPRGRAMVALCHGLLNSHEFIYLH